MSEIENAQSARALRDDELDLVSGGFRFEMGGLPCARSLELENTMVSS
jgi:hypothetical protein